MKKPPMRIIHVTSKQCSVESAGTPQVILGLTDTQGVSISVSVEKTRGFWLPDYIPGRAGDIVWGPGAK